jgi:hypothetical protein
MKSASSRNHPATFTSRLVIAGALALTLLGLAAAPNLRAETPPDQIKAAGAIPLTTDLLDQMDEFLKSVSKNDAAKAELTTVSKDPSITPENWGSVISAKCPKTVELFAEAEITPDDFGRAIFAIMACAMGEGLTNSADKAVKANATFVEANKERAGEIFGTFMMLGETKPGS